MSGKLQVIIICSAIIQFKYNVRLEKNDICKNEPKAIMPSRLSLRNMGQISKL